MEKPSSASHGGGRPRDGEQAHEWQWSVFQRQWWPQQIHGYFPFRGCSCFLYVLISAWNELLSCSSSLSTHFWDLMSYFNSLSAWNNMSGFCAFGWNLPGKLFSYSYKAHSNWSLNLVNSIKRKWQLVLLMNINAKLLRQC